MMSIKRTRVLSSSSSSKKKKDTDFKEMSQIEYTNKIIIDLRGLSFEAGIEYIESNNLESWLEDQLDLSTEYDMEVEEMYSIFYENNIDKEKNSIHVNSLIPPMVAPSYVKQRRGGNKTIKKQKKLVLYKGGVGPFFKPRFNTLTVLSIKDAYGNEVCKVYGSSLPVNEKIPELYKYFYKTIGIHTIISFQNCEKTLDGVHKSSCRKLGYNKFLAFEPSKIWKEMGKKLMKIKQKGKTRRIKQKVETTQFLTPEIKDMTAGTIPAFDELIRAKIWIYPTLIHCYAGFGRTGSALLYYWFRSHLLYKCDGKGYEVLNQPFIGLNGGTLFIKSATMYMYLMDNFKKNISKYSDSNLDPGNTYLDPGNTYSTELLIHELFKFEKLNSVNLFITRINYILLYSALFLNAQTDQSLPGIPALTGIPISEIYLYPLHDKYPNFAQKFSRGHIFNTPVSTNIYTFRPDNPFGLKLEIPQDIFDSSDSSS
jgi:hypothetical protein